LIKRYLKPKVPEASGTFFYVMKKVKPIAIQGADASFHHQAARAFFADEVEILPCRSFVQLCDALKQGTCDHAVMAIENTFAGSILPNYGLLQAYPFHIIGEHYLQISQHLMALPGQRIEQIEFVHSHPIALTQCNWFLEQNRHMLAIEKYDTAGSAQEIAQENLKGVAAIASQQAAELYGLQIIARDIENLKENHTRFLVLSREASETVDAPNKASICLEAAHKVGSLMEVLQVFHKHLINITKIQSVPIIEKPYQYQFHLDVEWGPETSLPPAIDELATVTFSQRVLGSYLKALKNDYTGSPKAAAGGGVLLL